jgi:hypothetical protein
MTTTVATLLLRIDLPPVVPNGLRPLFKLNSSNVLLVPTTVPILLQPHISSNTTAYRTLAHDVNCHLCVEWAKEPGGQGDATGRARGVDGRLCYRPGGPLL